MNSYEYTKNLLDRGLLLTIYYTNNKNVKKFVFLLKGKFINVIDDKKKLNANKYYDIFKYKEFNLSKNTISAINYNSLPLNKTINDILLLQIDDLIKNKSYIKQLNKKYVQIKNLFEEYCSEKLIKFKNLSEKDIFDFYILRFYPDYFKNTKNIYGRIKKDIVEKYFNNDEEGDNEFDLNCTIPAFKVFGICDKNINVEDNKFINALKRQWFKLIDAEKQKTIDKLKKCNLSKLSDEEKRELEEEISILMNELDKINFKNLNKLKTVKGIITYWPDILAPKPEFIYEH